MSNNQPAYEIWFRRSQADQWSLYEFADTYDEAKRLVTRAWSSRADWEFEIRGTPGADNDETTVMQNPPYE